MTETNSQASVDLLELSDGDKALLTENSIKTIPELRKYTFDELVELPKIGKVSARRIVEALDAYGEEQDKVVEEVIEALEALEEKTPDSEVKTPEFGELDQQKEALLRAIAWAIAVWERANGQQGVFLAGKMRDNTLFLFPDMTPEELASIPPLLDIDDQPKSLATKAQVDKAIVI